MNDRYNGYQTELFPVEVPKMPEEYVGDLRKNCGFTKTDPREWTVPELEWITMLRQQGYGFREIADSVGRSPVSVQIKLKRMGKASGSYNARHVGEKHSINRRFVDELAPASILDCYCGTDSYYRSNFPDIHVVTNDRDASVDADYHEDAFALLCRMYADGESFDIIDLDPFGSAFDCFDLAFKMARSGVAITFGEMGHRRFKRLDFVRRYYGIDEIGAFNSDSLVQVVQGIAARNKKDAVVFEKRDWQNISRVWFRIGQMRITEQWEG